MRRCAGLIFFVSLFGCGDSFESALTRSIDAPRRHWVSPDGGEEVWMENTRYARVVSHGGKVSAEARFDGSRTASFFTGVTPIPRPGRPTPMRPDPFGTVGTAPAVGPAGMRDPLALFREHPYTVLAARSKGDGREYDVRSDGPVAASCCGTSSKPTVYRLSTDASGRIIALAIGERTDHRFDYPAAIPAETFTPKLRHARTVDEVAAKKALAQGLKTGVARIGKTVIRAAYVDELGSLILLRTGGDPKEAVALVGVDSDSATMAMRTPFGLGMKDTIMPVRPLGESVRVRIGGAEGPVPLLRASLLWEPLQGPGYAFVPYRERVALGLRR